MKSTYLIVTLKVLIHLLPFWPMYLANVNLSVAAVLFMLLPYIKVRKLSQQLDDMEKNCDDEVLVEKQRTLLRFWRSLTLGLK